MGKVSSNHPPDPFESNEPELLDGMNADEARGINSLGQRGRFDALTEGFVVEPERRRGFSSGLDL